MSKATTKATAPKTAPKTAEPAKPGEDSKAGAEQRAQEPTQTSEKTAPEADTTTTDAEITDTTTATATAPEGDVKGEGLVVEDPEPTGPTVEPAHTPGDEVSEDRAVIEPPLEERIAQAQAALEAEAKDKAPDPSGAQLEPPAKRDEDSNPLEIPPTVNEASAERLRVTTAQTIIRDTRGEKIDPDQVFGPVGPDGLRRCLVRLIQHSTATIYNRPVKTLLQPVGASVSEQAAKVIIDTIRNEQD